MGDNEVAVGVKVAPGAGDTAQRRGGADAPDGDNPVDTSYDPRKRMSYDVSKRLADQTNKPRKYKVRVFCDDPHSSALATWFHLIYGLVIMLSVAAFCTETLNFKGKPIGYNLKVETYKLLEIVFTVVFCSWFWFWAVPALWRLAAL